MKNYIPLDPSHGEEIREADQQSEDQRRRLENETSERLRQILKDAGESDTARGNALLLLLLRKDSETQELLPDLFEDPCIGHLAIQYCCPGTGTVNDRLGALLDSPRRSVRIDAAWRLAMSKVETVRPYLLRWSYGEDQEQRNGAIRALMELDPTRTLEVVRDQWEFREQRSEEDRLVLAEVLLSLSDNRGRLLLESVARSGAGAWSSFAAFTIFRHDPALGCELLLHIIDDGDTEAKQSVVSQVWNFERNPNAFNAEGINEARSWVEWQFQEYAAGRQFPCADGKWLKSDESDGET